MKNYEKIAVKSHLVAPHAPSNAQANANITKAEIEAKLTGEISSHTHAGSWEGTGKLTVSITQPSNPSVNDLWYDIS